MSTKSRPLGIKPFGGKYRDIVLAAGLFVIFDLFVLVMNFYTSFEIAADATSINLAGRQRMLSQRMTKSLLQIETSNTAEQYSQAMDELKGTFSLFGSTFTAFKIGGETRNTDNSSIVLKAIEDKDAQSTLAEAETIWHPLQQNIQTLLNNQGDIGSLNNALLLANGKNVQLLKLMNKFTTRLAVLAQEKAEQLRLIQSVGITLALINFAFLLFHFIRKLSRSDSATEEARRETEEILTTVNDGFFLVDESLNLGHQYSSALETIFKTQIVPDTPFIKLLEGKVTQQTLDTASEFMHLLFTKRIRENLASDLNPLVKLEIDLSDSPQTPDVRYLNISFKRVQGKGKISHLLGTATDITEQVKLEKSLAAAESRSQEELEFLSQILHSNPLHLNEYLSDIRIVLLSINNMLEQSSNKNDYANIIEQSLPSIHKLKGDAFALGSDMFGGLMHEFEVLLKSVQNNPSINSKDLLPVTVQVNTILAKVGMVSQIIEKISSMVPEVNQENIPNRALKWQDELQFLAQKVGDDLGKEIILTLTQTNLNMIEEKPAGLIRDICIQMVRNAVVHGVETPEERLSIGKPVVGQIQIDIKADTEQTQFTFKDNGRGLSVDAIRLSLIKNGVYTSAQLAEMDAKSIIMSIFNSGVSTADQLSEHAGQGVGLSIVKQAMNALDGRLGIASRSGQFTEFRITFSNVALKKHDGVIAA